MADQRTFAGLVPFQQMPVSSDDKPPLKELGSVLWQPQLLPGWASMTEGDELEENPKLMFPESIKTYHGMRVDPQIQGLLTGAIWPLLRMTWFIDPNGARDEAVQHISADLNLPISAKGDGTDLDTDKKFNQRRTQRRFVFLDHLETALDAIAYGFMLFEQVGEIQDDGLFHYRKLALRPPNTITDVRLAQDGNLEWVRQHFANAPLLTIDRLVLYSFQRRGANWHGRSLLRGCYAPWLLKDRASRVGVMNIQRAGVGTPVATGHPGASQSDLQALEDMMSRWIAGDRSGGAIPYGANVRLVGVEGAQPDTVGFIKLMNEEMARSFFQMFMQLGQTTSGSRALGQTFVEYHKLVTEYIAQWFSNIFNEHVIEDDIEWNWGPDEEFAPLLKWKWDDQGSYENPQGPVAARNPALKVQQMHQAGTLQVPKNVAAALYS